VTALLAGRLPRTVCHNGGPVSPAVGTGPYPSHVPSLFGSTVRWLGPLHPSCSRPAASKWLLCLCPLRHR
jgi:hypothetical protein